MEKRISVIAAVSLLLGALPAYAAPPAAATHKPAAAPAKQKPAAAHDHPTAPAAGAGAKEHADEAKGEHAKDGDKEHADKEHADEGHADKDKDKDKDEKGAHSDAGATPEEAKAARKERREKRRAEIKAKWGDLVQHPAVRAELKVHAWRIARLNRIRSLADAAGKQDVVARVDSLTAKENARFEKHMETLKSKGGNE